MKKIDIPSIVVFSIIALVFAWIAISWIDVMANQSIGGTENAWNFFKLLLK